MTEETKTEEAEQQTLEAWPSDIQEALSSFTSGRQRAFVLAYCLETNFHKRKAAELAGYSPGNHNAQSVTASQLLSNPKVRNLVDRILAHLALSRAEVLGNLARMAGGTLDDVLEENGAIDIKKARQNGSIHNIKSYKTTTRQTVEDGNVVVTTQVEVQLHDAQAANDKLAKAHGLYSSTLLLEGNPDKPLAPPPKPKTKEERANEYVEIFGLLQRMGVGEP